MKKVAVIGSGISGLSAASMLAAKGVDVHLFEKNNEIGGRARVFRTNGFSFDMGPSWYWMPEVFENFYNKFGHSASDFYELKRLSPSFTVIFDDEVIKVPDSFDELCGLFESIETGASEKLRSFIADAQKKYQIAMGEMIFKPGKSLTEYLQPGIFGQALSMNLFSSFSKHLKKYFKHPMLISILQFPILFLGATPSKIPALYSMMNYAAFKMGTWYPMGGFVKVIDAFEKIALEHGVQIHKNEEVVKINVRNKRIESLNTANRVIEVDGVVGAADYNHVEQTLLDLPFRKYTTDYWSNRTLSPSCLIFYVGVRKKINKLDHHNLFFDADYDTHAKEIYRTKSWPVNPLFYVCCPSVTDYSVAPEGMENLFILMPLASGIKDDQSTREIYYELLMQRIERFAGEDISSQVIFKRSYCVSDFEADYHAYKGNAYGLANTLRQTAILKPKMTSRKVQNLFYAGQLTVPGPGVPPSIISGQIASGLLLNYIDERSI
jgi:phytoene desaturase